MAGLGGYNGWRWIFIIEGLATVVVAIVSKFVIVDWPETATFLTEEERALLTRRLAIDAGEANMNRLDKCAVKRVFSDVKIYLAYVLSPRWLTGRLVDADCCSILMYLGIVNTGYAISFFTPTILTQLGWTSIRAQVMSIPIYVVAAVVALTTAVLTDRLRHRFAFTICGCVIATVGYVVLLCQRSVPVGARYFAVYAVISGGYMTQPVLMGWLNNNMGGHYKRSIASAMQIGIGNCGGLVASNIFLSSQAPTYPVGYGVSLGLVWLCGISCVVFFFYLVRENRLRDQGNRDYLYQLPREELENLGDDHPDFRFTY
ncbi:hypothetical protein VTN77DRAFT_9113 [Rasamsonia byssochlamydoides]|uniref:uncharacterized protein n=1 Tax=Rasamsonia byssochlamydoides TaxID=89139 RepID=UPI003743F601